MALVEYGARKLSSRLWRKAKWKVAHNMWLLRYNWRYTTTANKFIVIAAGVSLLATIVLFVQYVQIVQHGSQ